MLHNIQINNTPIYLPNSIENLYQHEEVFNQINATALKGSGMEYQAFVNEQTGEIFWQLTTI